MTITIKGRDIAATTFVVCGSVLLMNGINHTVGGILMLIAFAYFGADAYNLARKKIKGGR